MPLSDEIRDGVGLDWMFQHLLKMRPVRPDGTVNSLIPLK